MGFAESVTACNQRDCFFVVHRHAEERFTNVAGRRDRIRFAVRPLGIHVDQPHLDRAKGALKLPFAAVAFVAEPRPFGAPVEFFGLPNVGAAAGETERLETHRFEGDVAGQNHKVGPGDFLAVLLLDRP